MCHGVLLPAGGTALRRIRRTKLQTRASTDLSEWAAHRRAVIFAVARQVPAADPVLATRRGLEQLCHEIAVHGVVDRPVDYWHHASVDVARASVEAPLGAPMTAVEHRRAGQPVLVAAPSAEAAAPLEMPPSIRPARPVGAAGRGPARGAAEVPVSDAAECRTTRGAIHDYIRNRLLPSRRKELENHLIDCAECTRAFVDVRESFWLLRAASPVLVVGTLRAPGAVPGAAGRAAVTPGSGG
ncbi:zf-HC2 domain-containing protein [Myceligenerans crystallogenes]|uniref:Putative zinc-finger domain-containing protein n=1 Tax=Myceligenerans crystallogenes TaxID=316335 RepID=A0ABN2NEN7_9MICO